MVEHGVLARLLENFASPAGFEPLACWTVMAEPATVLIPVCTLTLLSPVAGVPAAEQIHRIISQRTDQRDGDGFLRWQDLPVVLQQDQRLLRDFPRSFPVFRREDFRAGPFRCAAGPPGNGRRASPHQT